MAVEPSRMSCQEIQGQLAELIACREDLENHPHIQSCERCRELLKDLEKIAINAWPNETEGDGTGVTVNRPTHPKAGSGFAAATPDAEPE
jgi:hypothetical protein